MSPFRFAGMGTDVEVWPGDQGERVMDWFEQVESVASRFRPESELSVINRHDAPEDVGLSPLLAELLMVADHARRITDGLVDVGVGGAVKAWGYSRTFAEISDMSEPPNSIRAGYWEIEGRVLRRSPGTEIDLGGIAKGWACDRAVEAGLAAVVSAGGDLRSSDPDTIASVADAAGEVVVKIHVGQGALATSSVGKRRWNVAGSEVSHIVDPRTMRPVRTPVISATVLADSAVDAETGAKAVLLLGEDGLTWASRQPWIAAAVTIWHDGSVYGTPGLEVAA